MDHLTAAALATITSDGRKTFRAAQRTHLDGVRQRFLDQLPDDQLPDEQLQQLANAWTAIAK